MTKIIFDPENEKRPYCAINAVILQKINGDEHILLGKRKNAAGAGYYYIPGGHLKTGETLAEGLKREIKEEMGTDVEPGRILWVEEALAGMHHVTFYLEAVLIGGIKDIKNLEPEKCESWQWFPLAKLPKPLWHTLGQFVEEYRNKNRINRFAQIARDYIGTGSAAIILRSTNKKRINVSSNDFFKDVNPQELEVLMEKRGKQARNNVGLWELPGGRVEWGETVKSALAREIKEELGIGIEVGMQICAADEFLEKEGQQWVAITHVAKIIKGRPVNNEPNKIDEVRWFPLTKLPTKIAPVTKDVIDELLRRI